jgi:uncharacterized protein YaaQ
MADMRYADTHRYDLPEVERGGGPASSSNPAPKDKPHVRRLLFAVVQSQDVPKASRALDKAGLSVTELAGVGGFLGRRNVTLLVGLDENQEELAVGLINENCRQRVEYVSTPLEGAPLPIPVATPITVGGATVFTFVVERYEEI